MRKHMNRGRVLQAVLVILGLGVLAFLAKHYEYPDIQVSYVEEVVIPGMENEYEFLFLADLHLAILTREDAGPFGNAAARISAFANAKGTVSEEQLPQWIDYANKKEFDAVLMGGDMIDYYSGMNADYLKSQIDRLKIPYLYTLGNHEFFSPWEETIPADSVIYDLFADGSTAFQVMEYEDLAVCVIDNEAYEVNPDSFTAMKKWMEENPDKPVILLAHVPFYTEMDKKLLETSASVWGQPILVGEDTGYATEVTKEFMNLILSDTSPVVAIFTGDNHFYYKGNLTDSVTQWVAAPAYAGDGMVIKVKGN